MYNIIILVLLTNIISSYYYIKLIKIIYNFSTPLKSLNKISLNKLTKNNNIGIITIFILFIPTSEFLNLLTII